MIINGDRTCLVPRRRWTRLLHETRETMERSAELELAVMTYNVAHGRGLRFHQALVGRAAMERNLEGIARHILAHRPHIVALQEIDQGSIWAHRLDQLSLLKQFTGYAHALHGIHADKAVLRKPLLRYGVGILSRLEPIAFESRPFGLGRLDTKGFTAKRIRFNGRCVLVIALHLDFRRHKRRMAQAEAVVAYVLRRRRRDDHLIVMGDFNCTTKRPSSPLYYLMDALDLHTVDPSEYRAGKHASFASFGGFRLDYILADKDLVFTEYRTGNARLSDHEFVLARLRARRRLPPCRPRPIDEETMV